MVKVSPTLLEVLHLHFQMLVRIPMAYSRPLISETVVERVPGKRLPDEYLKPSFPAFYDALLLSSSDVVAKPEVTGHREVRLLVNHPKGAY